MATTRENKPITAVEWTKDYLEKEFAQADRLNAINSIMQSLGINEKYANDILTPSKCRDMLDYQYCYADNIPFATCETYNESNTNDVSKFVIAEVEHNMLLTPNECRLIIGKEPVYCAPTLRDNKIINVSICDTFNDLDTRIINQEDS